MKGSAAKHQSVLLAEAVGHLITEPDGVYVDATFGRGGHATEILKKLSINGTLLATDRDPEAIAYAARMPFSKDPRFIIKKSSFEELGETLKSLGLHGKVTGILFDLGVSSPQLDDAARGFSFLREGPLDMRMDPTQGVAAATWLSEVGEKSLADVLKTYGEERHASRIARAIVRERAEKPITTTTQLAEIVAAASPAKESHKHPATRCFQAIRIYINGELVQVQTLLTEALEALTVGGRMVAISFHSLEDRIVKQYFAKQSKGDEPPRGLPIKECDIVRNKRLQLIGRGIKPSEAEIKNNPRARSAVLRVAEKIA